tara:strand:+ start:1705 stop:1875 length:171 start_codon:yes stop_codon:yes gene_type:complete
MDRCHGLYDRYVERGLAVQIGAADKQPAVPKKTASENGTAAIMEFLKAVCPVRGER